jgi:SAM-dependent methyltransferase
MASIASRGAMTDSLFDRYYYLKPEFVNGTAKFFDLITRHVPERPSILEIGAGPTNPASSFLASLGNLTGLDVSEEVKQNCYLQDARVYDGGAFPFPSQSFDLCVSNFVLEHVVDPVTHFREVARVLKPGGKYCFRTPNLWHYIPLAARLMPHSIHLKLANRLRGLGDGAHDPWPTVYRANTLPTLKKLRSAAGLAPLECNLIESEPSYGRSSAFLFFPMMMYERLVNSTDLLRPFRINFQAVFQKP